MAEIRDRSFTDNEVVETDGNTFTGCTFANATLSYGGGEHPVFQDCTFDEVGWYFTGPALRTIQLLQDFNNSGGRQFVEDLFAPGNYIGA